MCGTENEAADPAPNDAHPGQNNSTASSIMYQRVDDYISNVSRYKIIESTLREGDQFINSFFTTEIKCKIATMLSNFGVDYIEVTSPASSPQSFEDCKTICKLGLKSKILTHVRCNMEDAKKAVECGVDGVDLVIGTSSLLRQYSHGKSMEIIQKSALEVIEYVKSQGIEVRFSSEDSFRSDLVDLLTLYKAVDKAGVVSCDIETHFHDDTGCAVANAITALEAGASLVDTSVLGIGERNGITPLGALMARMVVTSPEYTKSKYNLKLLREIDEYVASVVQVNIPFNNPITGFCAFTHKAGIHAKAAILANPSTYEIIDPALFGLTRYVSFSSRITGWNAVKSRVEQLGYNLSDDQIKEITAMIKQLGDVRPLAVEDADSVIHSYHLNQQEKKAT
ncbi:Homocitrate synthase, mitochondrial [Drechmeria coniospora]|uniref:homocitrate synthase n=1 Tax=Drechmeria coniospora TaxID=98403 RepID=A0A151GSD5_DRECN|nr:Homocitrate synthase, mitochondrial [Drechmeria coniospora]KYK59988.1 Homocitrate synthase, mitochondrial [Drechmeria coniospora]